jgi:hypothetical protein
MNTASCVKGFVATEIFVKLAPKFQFSKSPDARKRPLLVSAGEAAVADNIRDQNRRELSGLAHGAGAEARSPVAKGMVPFHEASHTVGPTTAARLVDDRQCRTTNVGQDERAVARHVSCIPFQLLPSTSLSPDGLTELLNKLLNHRRTFSRSQKERKAEMVWIAALIVIAPFALFLALALKLGRTDAGWREGAEGLRERWESRDATQ